MPHTRPSWPLPPADATRRRGASQFNRVAGSRSAAFAFWISQCWQAQEHDSRNGCYGILDRDRADHSALMPANLITLAHFSVSAAMSLLKSAGKPASAGLPRSASCALILGSARPALISLLSLSITSVGVPLGEPKPDQPLAS